MKKKVVLTGLCLSALLSSVHATSLRDSVQKALNNNPDIIAELKNQEAYRLYVDDREGYYLPTIDLEAYLETNTQKREYTDGTADEESDEDGYNAAIVFRQFLYDGGLTPSQVSEVKHEGLANKHRSLYAIENSILETVKVYTELVKSDEKLALTSNMIKTHEENLVTAKEKEEISGEVLETYQVSSKLNFVTDSYLEEKDIKETGLADYFKYVGSEPEGKVCRPVIDETKIPTSLKEAIELAILRNHKILEQIERIKVKREKIVQYDANFLPRLDIELKASIDKDLELDERGTQKDAYARLNFNWNLYNGNRDNVRSQQEALFLQEEKKTLDDITNQIVAEVKSVYGKFFKNKQRVEALSKYVEANVNIVEVYRNEFEAGTRTFVDILNAESELFNSSKSLINMEYAVINGYYDVLFSLSMLSDEVLASKNQNCSDVQDRIIEYKPTETNNGDSDELSGLISQSDSDLINKELGLDSNLDETQAVKSLDEKISNTASNDAMKMATSDYKSFLEAPKGYYTINLATKNGMGDASKYIKDNNLGDSAYAFEFGPSMKSAKVLYGVYPSVKAAKAAMKSLSAEVLANKPYVDNISKHQALYAKYN